MNRDSRGKEGIPNAKKETRDKDTKGSDVTMGNTGVEMGPRTEILELWER
jgi:hypothetical protein